MSIDLKTKSPKKDKIEKFTDTHCHISKKDFDDIGGVIDRAKRSGIIKMINNGSDFESNREVLELTSKYDCLYSALGYHPESVENTKDEDLKLIEENISNIAAIGEIGLDYHYEGTDRNAQKELFIKQLELAQKYDKPVIVHSRDATEDTIKVLKGFPTVKGSIHCFSGSLETARIYINMGYKLGFGGVTTFKNAKLKEILKSIPTSSILLETDSPYLSPEPVRGSKNEPKNVVYIADFIAKELGMTKEELSRITEKNVHELFDI